MPKRSRTSTRPTTTPAPRRSQEKTRLERYFRQRYPDLGELTVIHPRAAGIDLGGKESHFVAAPVGEEIEVREFGRVTSQLMEMAQYLCDLGVETVAMESTGVYWMPVCDLLEACGLEVYLVNPHHVKHVPGRKKSDKLDCRWLQKLHTYGLLSASFRPAREIRPLRSFLRHRTTLVRQAADWLRRMHKVLDQMNVRPHKALTDLGGTTGMRIVRALVAGEQDPAALARLRDPRCFCSEQELREALTGFYQPHLIQELGSCLRLYDGLLAELGLVDAQIEEALKRLAPQHAAELAARLAADTHALAEGKHAPSFNAAGYVEAVADRDPTLIPGIGPQIALSLLAELGMDMSKWPTEKHFGSHLTLAPQPKISGGRVLSCHTRPGTHPGAVLFRQAAAAVVKMQDSALAAFYRRLALRIGKAKALTALAYKLARMYYHLMKEGRQYVEAGVEAYEEKYRRHRVALLHKHAKQLGFTLQPVAT